MIIIIIFDHVNIDNAVVTYNITLIPFDSGTKASSLDQNSMTQNSRTGLHESVIAANGEGP